MEDLPPPPPYSAYDPAAVPTLSLGDDIPGTEGSTSVYRSVVPDESYVSGAPYFALRPATAARPSNIVQYRLLLLPNSSPENVKFPGQDFLTRGVNQHDWSTFLNHMFPLNSVCEAGNASITDEKVTNYKPSRGPVGSTPSVAGGIEKSTRRRTIRAVISEWNSHFFVPRGIRITSEFKMGQSQASPAISSIDARPFGGETALYKAISASDSNTVKLLLSKGANPDAKAYGGEPAVHRAVSKVCRATTETEEGRTKAESDRRILDLLLAYGADVDANPPGCGTPLHAAVSKCNEELVTLLIHYGADVDAKPLWGETPLYAAASKSEIKILKILVAAGADVDDSPAGCESALHVAVGNGDIEIVEVLLGAGAKLGGKYWTGGSPVQIAAQKGDVNMVRRLLESGAKVDEASAGCYTPLGEATSREDIEMVRVCLEFGADPGKQKAGLESPLAIAVGKGNQQLLDLMLGGKDESDGMRARARKIAEEKGHLELLPYMTSDRSSDK